MSKGEVLYLLLVVVVFVAFAANLGYASWQQDHAASLPPP
jgi:hypothetical protein